MGAVGVLECRGERREEETLNRAGGGRGVSPMRGFSSRWGWGIPKQDNSSSGSVGISLAYKFPSNLSQACLLKPE